MNVVDYEGASTRDKERLDLLVTTNSSGCKGCNIPVDMCCEHNVRKVKTLLRSYHNQLEHNLIVKSVKANNSTMIIRDHVFDSLGKGDLKAGGDHRQRHLQDEEKKIVRKELRRLKMFDPDSNRNVKFNITIRRVWENLKDENVDIFLNRNSINYKAKKTYRFN